MLMEKKSEILFVTIIPLSNLNDDTFCSHYF